jgi:hypothetical protein
VYSTGCILLAAHVSGVVVTVLLGLAVRAMLGLQEGF